MAHIDGVWIPIILFSSFPVMLIGYPIARALGRRIEHKSLQPNVPPDVTARLERMEQAIDSIAIEVERISEGQRFTTRLLSERSGGAPGQPGDPSRLPEKAP